jgi:hypothetical protein
LDSAGFVRVVLSQSFESLRWFHRKQLLRGLLARASHESEGGDEVATLLRDPRLSVQAGSTLISGIVGHVTHFLPQCCESESCAVENL